MKKFVLYKDLVVREFKNITKSDLINETGVIIGSASKNTFTPSYFSKTKKGRCVTLWDWKIENDKVKFNDYFYLTKILEKPDSKKERNYYKEVNIELSDRLDSNIIFDFFIEPNQELSCSNLQSYFEKINGIIENSDSVGMYLQKKKNIENEEKIKELIQKIDKLNSELKTKEID